MTKQLTITEMKTLAPNWFNKGAMSFFNTKIESKPNVKNYFVTSEYMNDPSEKKYSVRWFNCKTNQVDTIGEFQGFETFEQAKAQIKKLSKMNLVFLD